MVILLLAGFCVVAGAILYLPFFLWFRFARRGRDNIARSQRLTNRELVAGVVMVAVLLGARVWSETHRGPGFQGLMRDGVLLKVYLLANAVGAVVFAWRHRSGKAPAPADPPSQAATDTAESTLPKGVFHASTWGSVPVLVHWSFLVVGAFTGMLAGVGQAAFVAFCAAYAAVVALHEAAHAVVARHQGLRVHAIVLTGQGGACLMQLPRSVGATVRVYAAGLVAQVALLVATLSAVALFGAPTTAVGDAVVTVLTWVNGMLIVVNLVPDTTLAGVPTDGAVLWGLIRHVRHGAPHPLAAQYAESPVFDPSTCLLTVDGLKPDGFVCGIELLNDDTTPMEFVVEMLERHAAVEREAAVAMMLEIHRHGGLLLPQPTLAVAQGVADAITREARARGHALVCRAVAAAD